MGRPPCCDKVGVKKGPWTPEEDIILVSYIQEHGPGNWRSVPTNTGLLRCSKSCRLRWTNYLRPGIKRGNFTAHEEGMIIHLQALLGNKWAAIASYLPQRTDNDIKNYWNTHLKKKLKKFQAAIVVPSEQSVVSAHHDHHFLSNVNKSSNVSLSDDTSQTLDKTLIKNSSSSSNNSSSTYASSTENISRLLEGWMRSSPKIPTAINGAPTVSFDPSAQVNHDLVSSWERSTACSDRSTPNADKASVGVYDHDEVDAKLCSETPPMSFLEKWLLDETSTVNATVGQVEEMMELSTIF